MISYSPSLQMTFSVIVAASTNVATYLLTDITTCLTIVQSKRELEHQVAEINASRPQCPVGLNTLVLPSKNTISDSDKTPYVYLNCGHVHGQHSWGKGVDVNNCTCPMCLKVRHGSSLPNSRVLSLTVMGTVINGIKTFY